MGSFDNKGPGLEGYASSNEIPEAGHSEPIKRGRWSLAVDQEASSFAATPNASNADFDPIPPSKRTWGSGAYIAYWMADAWAVSNWEVGESFIQPRRNQCI
jgi:NCS1 family nucleobase:cation symporter-1